MSHLIRGLGASGGIRVVAADTTELVRHATEKHATSPTAGAALGRTLTGALLLSHVLLKHHRDRVTLKLRGDGPLGGVIADAGLDGTVRGYVSNPHADLPLRQDGKLDVGGGVGRVGEISVIRAHAPYGEPYGSSSDLVSGEIAEDIATYLARSEQIASALLLGVHFDSQGRVTSSGGVILQALPGADEAALPLLEANVKALGQLTSAMHRAPLTDIVRNELMWGMDFEVLTDPPLQLRFACRCSEEKALEAFGAILTPGDQKARMDYLLYGRESDAALRAAKRLGSAEVALARARIAADRKSSGLRTLLENVPNELHGDPGYIFARIQLLRREEKFGEAARLMLNAPRDPNRLYNVDEWWIERRLLARKMIDVGEYRTAYLIARDAALPARDIYKTEQEFTAGWIALRFLKDPNAAARHFARIGVGSVNPTALARAGYWQGRAAEAAGRIQEARHAYAAAAEQSTSYYGQLARAKLGLPQIELRGVPGSRSRAVERLEIVRAAQLLYAIGKGEFALPIFADMGENGDPDAVLGLGELAARQGDARAMLLAGKAALNRGLPFDFYAYPVSGIPSFRPIGPDIERSIVYAIARQESAFNPSVVSPAHAYGLMQVTPDAGRYVCKKYGVGFDLQRMKNEPAYNAALGAAELGGLLEDYRGSYILTFAAYNAGRGSVKKWIARYGDPRDPGVDAVDWVELIPFSETRNYVQRIMENLQVYRARFGGGSKLQIEADLHRGSIE